MATTVHRKEDGEQEIYLIVPAADATGRKGIGRVLLLTTIIVR